MTKVIHIRNAPEGWETDPQYVYIGRPGRGQTGYFGNPFPLNGGPRGSTIKLFEEYARNRIQYDSQYAYAIKRLRDRTLVCFCRPLACHGDVLKQLAEEAQ